MYLMARPAGFEPATYGLEGRCTIRLCYGRSGASMPASRRRPNSRWLYCLRECAAGEKRSGNLLECGVRRSLAVKQVK